LSIDPAMIDERVSGPLEGIRVVEVGLFAAGPACGAVLGDWGAEVVKVEPPTGDPARRPGRDGVTQRNPRHELHNRGKKGLALDLKSRDGREVMDRLLGRSDVLVSNLRPRALSRIELDWPRLAARHPALICGLVSGYGIGTGDENRASYDHGAFWSATGAASLFGAGGIPAQPTGGMGDRVAGSLLAGGIAAALLERTRTGRGQLVTASLLGTGLWMIGSEASDALAFGAVRRKPDRLEQAIPTLNCFRAGDGRWFWLLLMEPARHWGKLVLATGSELLASERFRGGDPDTLREMSAEVTGELDRVFAARSLAQWTLIFDRNDIWHAPVREVSDAVRDPSAVAAGAVVGVVGRPGEQILNSPVMFTAHPRRALRPAPAVGEHGREVLASLGYDETTVELLVEHGVLGSATER
jgi:crotonobetainyl-CoA:carnitine CoA-transferase CaiB-like acyl-CoA transferase